VENVHHRVKAEISPLQVGETGLAAQNSHKATSQLQPKEKNSKEAKANPLADPPK
jgi:hypothetical protein